MNMNITLKPRYLTDAAGHKTDVVLSLREYEELIEELEDLTEIREYESEKENGEKLIPWEEAKKQLNV